MDLFQEVKRKLCVTWDDDDAYIKQIIRKSKEYIDDMCGFKFNYRSQGKHRTLMIERCFYDYSNALSDFEKNYHGELIALIIDAAVKNRGQPDV